jgi:tetratricopeptide (TPR) repeat protein
MTFGYLFERITPWIRSFRDSDLLRMSDQETKTESVVPTQVASVADAEAALLQWTPRMGELTVADKIEQGEMLKKQANLLFKRGELKPAVARYAKVFAYVNGLSVTGDAMAQYATRSAGMNATAEQGQQIQELKIACWSNMAFCYVKMGTNPERAVEYCDKVLAEDAAHSKALFRKAQALVQLKHFERAHAILTALATAEPKNAAARNELKALAAVKKKYDDDARDKSGFKDMFNTKKASGGGLF